MAASTPIHAQYAPIGNYLINGRLQDVITLITVLAVDEYLFRNEEDLRTAIRGTPLSGAQWVDIALKHPEFFRPDADVSVALLPRSYFPVKFTTNGAETRDRLTMEQTQALINVAISLHDKRFSRRQLKYTIWIPIVVALLAGGAAIFSSIVTHNLNTTSIKSLQDSIEGLKTLISNKK